MKDSSVLKEFMFYVISWLIACILMDLIYPFRISLGTYLYFGIISVTLAMCGYLCFQGISFIRKKESKRGIDLIIGAILLAFFIIFL